MANLSKIKRDNMIAFLEELKKEHSDDASIRAFNEIENHLRDKKYGLIWEEHSEAVDEMLEENIPVLTADPERRLCKDETLPWNFIIEGDNLQALYLLEKTHRGKVDCIYIDPPYNTGATDWKYNNDYVVKDDEYRHSKWLSMMKNRLLLAKHLLNPDGSVLIVTIDEKEYLRLGCLLEELFPTARIQMISSVINPHGANRKDSFARVEEYIYFVFVGHASVVHGDCDMLHPRVERDVPWAQLIRCGVSGTRKARPNQFYPIFFDELTGAFHSIGDSLPLEMDRNKVVVPKGCVAVFPINNKNGNESVWGLYPESFMYKYQKGYIKFGKWNSNKKTRAIKHLQSGMIQKIDNGEIEVLGYDDEGTIILGNAKITIRPVSLWNQATHDAGKQGADMLHKMFKTARFPFPKSVYAVQDALRFIVGDKKDAIIVDFFAGSGTTMHAVNLLNAEDEGNRICIMVTNNEISAEDEKRFATDNYGKENLVKWNKSPNQKNASYKINYKTQEYADFKEYYGIAKYVTWPRTMCTINGVDIDGNVLKGCYLGTDISMADGFKANVKFFKCSWTPRKPEDYLLSNVLCLHIREMIELQNAIEVDNVKNVLILNKSDFKNIILNPDIYAQIEHIWVNQNIILNAEELKLLEAKGYKYIPREFFGQELKEAAE